MFKVLLVDDELYTREGLEALIDWEKLGFQICGKAENGEEALKNIEETKPDIIITDIKMPLMNGLELIKKVTEEVKPEVKFIVLSGYNEFNYAKEAMRYGVKNYILKPIEEEELKKVLREIHEEIRKEREFKENNLKVINALSEISLKTILQSATVKESIDDVRNFFGIEDVRYFRYMLLEIENLNASDNDSANKNRDHYMTREFLKEIMGGDYKYNILKEVNQEHNSTNYGIIITEKLLENYNNDITFFTELIYRKLTSRINKRIWIFVGKCVNDLLSLNESYDSVSFIYNVRLYKNNSNIIYYDDVKINNNRCTFDAKSNFDDLIEAIENNNTAEICKILDNYFIKEEINHADFKMLQININYLIYQIIKIVSKMKGESTEILEYSSKLNLKNFMSYDVIRNNLKDFSKFCAGFINRLRQKQSYGILNDIEKYICENYCKRITIKDVANQFYINPAYLGQVFRKKYGISFNDYLHQYRIEKSKELLKHTDFKIYEISEKIGYKDSDSFIEKFEKINRTTPSQYRKRFKSSLKDMSV